MKFQQKRKVFLSFRQPEDRANISARDRKRKDAARLRFPFRDDEALGDVTFDQLVSEDQPVFRLDVHSFNRYQFPGDDTVKTTDFGTRCEGGLEVQIQLPFP